MTDPIVSIEPTELSVEPGGQGRLSLRIRNVGTIVENYRIEVLSETPGVGPSAWGQAEPAEVSIYPKEEGTATIVLSPPPGTDTRSGRFPFGIRVTSTVPPHASSVAEGDLEVGRTFGLQATITPMTSTGRWRGHHLISIVNWGNGPVRLRLTARDPDERLGFLLLPGELQIPLGGTGTARLTVRTRKPFLRGTPARLPFEVVAEPDDAGRVPTRPPAMALPGDPQRPVLNGVLMQKPIVSKVAVAVAAAAAVAVAAAVVLAVRVPKPKAAAEVTGLPNPPTRVVAALKAPDHIEVSWQLVDSVPTYQVVEIVGGKNQDSKNVSAPTQVFQATGLEPGTLYCFAVRSMRDPTHVSAASPPACRKTPAAAASSSGGSGAPGGSGGSSASGSGSGSSPAGSSSPGSGTSSGPPVVGGPPSLTPPADYVVLVGMIRGRNHDLKVRELSVELGVNGFPTSGIINTADYPNLTINGFPPTLPFYAVWAGPFDFAGGSAQVAQCHTKFPSVQCLLAKPGQHK